MSNDLIPEGVTTMHRRRSRQSGQTLVLFATGLVAIIAMVGLIIDGGNAYAQQRATQNGSDSAAEAGATMLARSVLGAAAGAGTPASSQLDASVLAATNRSAASHNLKPFDPSVAGNSAAYYTDILGNLLTPAGSVTTSTGSAAQVGSGAVPDCSSNCLAGRAAGVEARGQKPFATLIARAIGIASFTAGAQATAVAGYAPATGCSASEGCALLPITFATNMGTCTGQNKSLFGTVPWPWPVPAPYTPANESTLAVCGTAQGAFGFLDFGCAPNLAQQISGPCNISISFPSWLQTQPGNTNSVETALNAYAGNVVGTYENGLDKVVYIPFFDAICSARTQPAPGAPVDTSTYPAVCVGSGSGGGNNVYYRVKYFLGFALDHAYVQGNNNPACNALPGLPLPGGNGGTGCLKGWGVSVVQAPGTVTSIPQSNQPGTPLRIQLIK